MQIFTVESISGRPLLTSLANDDSLLIIDASDGNSVKRVALSVLKAFIGSTSPNPSPTPTPTPTPTPSNFALRVNSGGGDYVDSNSNTWLADFGFSGGNTSTSSSAISNTLDDDLYKSERWGNTTYSLSVVTGNTYTVNLLFCETNLGNFNIGSRVFRIRINGQTALDNFDIFAQAGGATAIVKSFVIVAPSSSLQITTEAIIENPLISGIEVLG